jgi:hypothetical protein
MKRKLLYATNLVVFLFFISSAKSQITKPNFEGYKGHKLISVIENKTDNGSQISVDGSQKADHNQSIGNSSSKTEILTWETKFDKKTSNQIGVEKKLKRAILILDRPFGVLKYDSDNSFESTDGSERLVKKFTDVLNKSSVMFIEEHKTADTTPNVSKVNKLWNSELPVYESDMYWNGLIFNVGLPAKIALNNSWNTSMELNDRKIENTFTILKIDGDDLTVSLKSKETYKDNASKSVNAEGAPAGISLGLSKKQKTYDGVFYVNAKTMFILSGVFKLETISGLSLNGGSSERKSFSTTKFTNSFQ